MLDNVDPSTITLKFDTIEDFDKALDTLKVETDTNTVVKPLATNSTADYDAELIRDTYVSLSGVKLTTIRHKIFAEVYWNSSLKRNLFSKVISQKTYNYGSNTGSDWDEDRATNGITDGGRTVWGKVWGHNTLNASVGAFDVGYTWDQVIYDEWGI